MPSDVTIYRHPGRDALSSGRMLARIVLARDEDEVELLLKHIHPERIGRPVR